MVNAKKKAAKGKPKKPGRLLLEDYEDCLALAVDSNSDGEYTDLINKLRVKIEKLENPPPKKPPREKTGFQCIKCKHQFKQIRNHCPTCDSEKIKKISLDEFMK